MVIVIFYLRDQGDCPAGDLYRNHVHETHDAGSLQMVREADKAFWREALVTAK